jgi:hypothetical protein
MGRRKELKMSHLTRIGETRYLATRISGEQMVFVSMAEAMDWLNGVED